MLSKSLLNLDTMPDRISIAEIAAEFGVSNSHCNRVFKSVYQVSPRQYLSQLIVQTAKTLLDQSDLKIVRISQLLGYGDPIHFSKQFKKWTGVSPRDFRNRSGVKKTVI
jgi:AraC-like DNA-binding protein